MSMYRTKCRNSLCKFEGMMEGKSDKPFVKKAFADKKLADQKAKGTAPASETMALRCPKCGTRWKMRADQLR